MKMRTRTKKQKCSQNCPRKARKSRQKKTRMKTQRKSCLRKPPLEAKRHRQRKSLKRLCNRRSTALRQSRKNPPKLTPRLSRSQQLWRLGKDAQVACAGADEGYLRMAVLGKLCHITFQKNCI